MARARYVFFFLTMRNTDYVVVVGGGGVVFCLLMIFRCRRLQNIIGTHNKTNIVNIKMRLEETMYFGVNWNQIGFVNTRTPKKKTPHV